MYALCNCSLFYRHILQYLRNAYCVCCIRIPQIYVVYVCLLDSVSYFFYNNFFAALILWSLLCVVAGITHQFLHSGINKVLSLIFYGMILPFFIKFFRLRLHPKMDDIWITVSFDLFSLADLWLNIRPNLTHMNTIIISRLASWPMDCDTI